MDLNDIYGVATFYKSFSLTPKGKHSITLCLGTACHVRGGPKILREMKKLLKYRTGPDDEGQEVFSPSGELSGSVRDRTGDVCRWKILRGDESGQSKKNHRQAE